MKTIRWLTGLALMAAAGAAFAQTGEAARQERMDDAYRNWQQQPAKRGIGANDRATAPSMKKSARDRGPAATRAGHKADRKAKPAVPKER